MRNNRIFTLVCFAILATAVGASAQTVRIDNGHLAVEVEIRDGLLIGDAFQLAGGPRLESDADFGVEVMWTNWSAPGRFHNADTQLILDKSQFRVTGYETKRTAEGQWIVIACRIPQTQVDLVIEYLLPDDAWFVRKRLVVSDDRSARHFLRQLWPARAQVRGTGKIVKSGGFGEPAAVLIGSGSAFFGLEYPAATTRLVGGDGGLRLEAFQEFGEKIAAKPIASDWLVTALCPDHAVKRWFGAYLEQIRVSPLRPYLLYNSWYDVRAPEYTDRPEDVMSEESVLRIARDFRREFTEKRGITLDAFVLDDGWDIYRSDWRLRPTEFPRGLAPIAEELRANGTALGIWFGPTGGYSHRDWRISWMRDQGYEVVGDQLCLAGARYSTLLRQRVEEFAEAGVSYFKWDGIQFSCSEPDHGHPIDIYSRRAVMESVNRLAHVARNDRPDMFLNITSGTWLSPWWLKTANQIWMQGEDYGYANVPSISKRDRAITYRDVVLYEDFNTQDSWFPIANLMTHGIIKGHLQKLGGEAEALDKFTDDIVLYFARGVSMWELYISPNLLSAAEWDTHAEAIRWARDRFATLMNTEMIGGDPGRGEAYGYLHLRGDRGVIAVRNPMIAPARLKAELSYTAGIDPAAHDLVLDRVYPTRRVAPSLLKAGDTIELELEGYETAIYEIYPLKSAAEPLPVNVTYTTESVASGRVGLRLLEKHGDIRLLDDKAWRPDDGMEAAEPVSRQLLVPTVMLKRQGAAINLSVTAGASALDPVVAFLFRQSDEPAEKSEPLKPAVTLNGTTVTADGEQEPGHWAWFIVPIKPGENSLVLDTGSFPAGSVSAWLVCEYQPHAAKVLFHQRLGGAPQDRPLPPLPRPSDRLRKTISLGEATVGR